MVERYAFRFDSAACSGCRTCQIACKDKHDLAAGLRWRRVWEVTGGDASLAAALIFGFELSSPPDTLAGQLVLRMRVSDEQTPLWSRLWSRGLALQDAAGILGCKAPRIRVAESRPEDLGGPFIIMDRVAGISIMHWIIISILIGLIVSAVLWNGWLLLAGSLLGSLVLGLSLGMLKRSLHSLAIEDVKHIYSRHGLKDTDVEISQYLQTLSDLLTDNNLEEFLPGLKWLQK